MLVRILRLLAVVASDVWVFSDASSACRRGEVVRARVGTFVIETPRAWFVACVVLWIVFFPLYVLARRTDE